MAVLRLSKPPALPAHVSYSLYRDWLLYNFYDHVCSYCIVQHESLQVEHWEPIAYAPERERDPSNFLLACPRCNRGKSDYHPAYVGRRTRKHEKHGFEVIDVRKDDLACMFDLLNSGELRPKPGTQYERALWNALLLKLDVAFVTTKRAECLRVLKVCEGLVSQGGQKAEALLKVLIPVCAKQHLLFRVFDVQVSDALQFKLNEFIATHRPAIVT